LQFVGAGLFAFTLWIVAEPGFSEFIDMLDINAYYIGVYVLILCGLVVMIISFLGCCGALMEHVSALGLVSALLYKFSISNFQFPKVLRFSIWIYCGCRRRLPPFGRPRKQ
jgi:hypothetical protein